MSDKASTAQLENLQRNVGINPSAIRYLALHSVVGTNVAAGTECNDAAYARQVIGWGPVSSSIDSLNFTGSYSTGNTASVTFPAFTAQQTVAEWSIYDAVSGGNRYYHKAISSATWPAGYALSFPSGSISVLEQ